MSKAGYDAVDAYAWQIRLISILPMELNIPPYVVIAHAGG
jgi:hypothetical protein